ncbi:hypothetical protein [Nocardia noduli]|uniref:hypothetical protein n=1 Tax=Nocardia noduli TaxID=2815722 RepID=UPI001C22741E|nr:hypothetical protein [Nocardia noduli]
MNAIGTAAPSLSLAAVSVRRRRRLLTAAVVVVALLVALLVCHLLTSGPQSRSRAHAHVGMTASQINGEHEHAADSTEIGCIPRTGHCVAQVVLPARITDPFAIGWLIALLLAAVVAVSVPVSAGRWTRGPPHREVVVAVGGREILNRFCIARR